MSSVGVSVALATYQGVRHLDAQLTSLAAQTRPPDELVVADDGSTDGTLELIDRFARNVPFEVRVLRSNGRLGWIENTMRAVRGCRRSIIAPCDQDDVWVAHKLQRCSELLEDPTLSLVAHTSATVDGDLRPGSVAQRLREEVAGRVAMPLSRAHRPLPAGDRRYTLGQAPITFARHGMSLVFRRDVLQVADDVHRPHTTVRPDDGLMSHDWWICLLAPLVGDVLHLAEDLVHYRRHGDNASNTRSAIGGDRGLDGLFSIDDKVARYRTMADRHDEVARLLGRLGNAELGDLDERGRRAARERSALFARAADLLRSRAAAVSEDGAVGRLAAVARLATRGAYLPRRDGVTLGLPSLAVDVAASVRASVRRPANSADQ